MSFREDLSHVSDWAVSYLERVPQLPVAADVQPGQVRKALPDAPPESPEAVADILRDLDEIVVPGLTHWNHPRFFAWFANTGSEPGILGELLIATLNVNVMTWLSSPAGTEIETAVMDWLAQLLGLPRSWHGHIEDTASTATVAALAAARHVRPGGAVYASNQANFSVEKAARLVGLEFRAVDTDDEFRMRADFPLDGATAVVATVGTTGSTAVDPVPELARRCADAGVWLHVDAAYAGAAAICPELRWCFDGVDQADSVVVNPHKWLFTPMDCSLLYVARPDDVRRAFSLVPDILRTREEATNLMDLGLALGRRFRALKLWAVIRCYGAEGLRERIREHVRLAALFEGWVRAEPGWEVVAPRPFSVVCFRREGTDEENERIADAVNASGEAFMSPIVLDGRTVLRLAVGNIRTTEADVARAWDALRRAAG